MNIKMKYTQKRYHFIPVIFFNINKTITFIKLLTMQKGIWCTIPMVSRDFLTLRPRSRKKKPNKKRGIY